MRRSIWLPLAVWALVFVAYSLTVSTDGINTDPYANSRAAWRMATTGTPWMDGLDLTEAGRVVHYLPGRDGHMVATATPGPKLAAVPFYLGASNLEGDFDYLPGSLAAAFWTSVAILLLFLTLDGLVSRRLALGATAVVAFATPMWSVSANALWTHPIDLLGIALAAWGLRANRLWLVGIGFGIGIQARPHIAVIAATVGIGLAVARRSPRPAIRIGLPSAAGLLLLTVWGYWLWDKWSVLGGYNKDVSSLGFQKSSLPAAVAGFFVSPERGLLVWTPLLILLSVSIVRGWRAAPDWTKTLFLGGVAYTAIQIYVNPYGGDAFWAYRHGIELVVCMTPLATATADRLGPRLRSWVPLAVGYQFAAIALGSIFDYLSFNFVYGDEWTDSNLGFALRNAPIPITLFLLLLGGLAFAVTRWAMSTGPDREVAPADAF